METLRKIADRLFSGWDTGKDAEYDASPANIYEGADGYLIQIAAPGVKADDVSVHFSDDILTVAVKRTIETESSGDKKLLRSERGNYDFTRSFSLTNDIDPEKIDAKVLNGFLLLHLTKKPESKPRKIEVKVK
jgi:HSP20 family protein